jgi:hypothetical protein
VLHGVDYYYQETQGFHADNVEWTSLMNMITVKVFSDSSNRTI